MSVPDIYDLLIERSRGNAVVDELLIGLTWTMCRADGLGLAMSPGVPNRLLRWPGTIRGQHVAKVAGWLRSWDRFEATVAMAAINAVVNSQSALVAEAQSISLAGVPANLSVFEWFRPQLQGKRIVIVGRYPGLERYESEFDITVIERNPIGNDLPDPACEYLLPNADWVFLTACSLINKTFPRLVELARHACVVLMGPTVPWLAEFKDYGIDYLAGVRVDNANDVRCAVAEGAGIRLFECGASYCVLPL